MIITKLNHLRDMQHSRATIPNNPWKSGIIQYEMRLIIEGAIALYEGDAVPLLGLANNNQQYDAADAFDSIGTALYGLREHVRNLQKAHRQEVLRECEDM